MLLSWAPFDPPPGPRALQPIVERWRDAGADICIINLSTPHEPDVVDPLAVALAEIDDIAAYHSS